MRASGAAPGGAVGSLPGFFGKLPALGDFVTRGLPASFVEPWDRFLQAGLAASREQFGSAWTGHFLSAPLWRFLLAPGVVTGQAWLGVLLPSVDRVGRYFPLTVAASLAPAGAATGIDGPGTLRAAAPWFEAVEPVALEALSPRVSPDALASRLAALPLLTGAPAQRPGGPAVLWWTTGCEIAAACMLGGDALPADRRFCALLDGAWETHGWPQGAVHGPAGV